MLPQKQQSLSGHSKSQHLFCLPTDLERCRTGEVGSQWGNASFLPLKWLLLILVSPEDTSRLMGVLVGLTLQQFLIEKKSIKKKKEAESHCSLAKENCSCLSSSFPLFQDDMLMGFWSLGAHGLTPGPLVIAVADVTGTPVPYTPVSQSPTSLKPFS